MSRTRAAVFLAAVSLGCSSYQPQPVQHGAGAGDLPGDVPELLALADTTSRLGPDGPDHVRSRAAAEKALALEPHNGEAAWRAARAIYFLTAAAKDDQKVELSARCIDVSAIAVAAATTAEPYFYQALCMGARAQAVSVEGLDLVKRMVEAGALARALDPQALHAGADRLLGGIFLRAPAWPASLGDIDAAIEHLERAVELAPEWAENHLLLAEALEADDQRQEARTALERARALMHDPIAAGWVRTWTLDLKKVESALAD